MEFPSRWLVFMAVVYGVFGCFSEFLSLMMFLVPVPLGAFFNESSVRQHGDPLTASDVQGLFSQMSNCTLVGSIVSTLFLVPLMDVFGRKRTIIVGRVASALCAAVLVLASRHFCLFELFAVAQVVIGLAEPLRLSVTKLYVTECCPDRVRAFVSEGMSAMNAVFVIVINMLALPSVLGNAQRWHYFVFFTAAFLVCFVPLALVVPESPKYQAYSGAPERKVKRTVTKFHGLYTNTDEVLANYEREFVSTKTRHISFLQMWRTSGLRSSLALVFVTHLVNQFSPNFFATMFGIPFRMSAGFTNEQAVLFNTVTAYVLFPLHFAMPFLYERVGRRPIFLLNMTLHLVGGTCLVVSMLWVQWRGPGALAMILVAVWGVLSSVSTGLGGLTFYLLLIADIVPVGAKAAITQTVVVVGSVAGILVNLAYAQLHPLLGPFFFLLQLTAPALCLAYCWFKLPETGGRATVDNFEEVRSRAPTLRRDSLLRHRDDVKRQYGSIRE